MDTKPVSPAAPLSPSHATVQSALRLTVGQQLTARVVAAFPDQNLLHLDIGGHSVRAQSALRLAVGASVRLQVVSDGATPTLKVIPTATEDRVTEALRVVLPKQQAPSALVDVLLKALPRPPQSPLPRSLAGTVDTLLQSIPRLSTVVKPASLAAALRSSGLFLEAGLAATPPVMPGGDLKAGLLRLSNALSKMDPAETDDSLEPLVDGLKKNTDGAVARILLDQLASLPKPSGDEPSWHMTLPLIHDDTAQTLRLTIYRDSEKRASAAGDAHWSVALELQPPGLDRIACRLSLHDGAVDARFWCEREATTLLIERHLTGLTRQFQDAGLLPGQMEAFVGRPPHPEPTLHPHPLINERA